MISCASLRGANFHADSRKVHQLLKNYLVVESAEQWIHDIEHLNNGRRDMQALRNHYQGEGNASHRIATTEKLKETLYYKSEHSLTFTTFLDHMQKMFNIFQEEGERMLNSRNYSSGCNTRNCKTLSRHLKCDLTSNTYLHPSGEPSVGCRF